MRAVAVCILFFTFSICLNLDVQAAKITAAKTTGCDVTIEGRITKGDFEKLAALTKQLKMLRTLFMDDGRGGKFACLDSPGGNYFEGLLIAKLLLNNAIGTKILSGKRCLSSCGIIFMAGTSRGEDSHSPNRILHINGTLGFHAPYLSIKDAKLYTAKDMETVFDIANRMMSDFVTIFSYQSRFFNSPWIRSSLISAMYAKARNEMTYVNTVGLAGRWQIELVGYKKPKPATPRGLAQACVNFQAWSVDKSSWDVAANLQSMFLNGRPRKNGDGFYRVDTGGEWESFCDVKFQKNNIEICSVEEFSSVRRGKCPKRSVYIDYLHVFSPNKRIKSLR